MDERLATEVAIVTNVLIRVLDFRRPECIRIAHPALGQGSVPASRRPTQPDGPALHYH
jgi:hypothetical protein